jgi:hypothetical protein
MFSAGDHGSWQSLIFKRPPMLVVQKQQKKRGLPHARLSQMENKAGDKVGRDGCFPGVTHLIR